MDVPGIREIYTGISKSSGFNGGRVFDPTGSATVYWMKFFESSESVPAKDGKLADIESCDHQAFES